MSVTEALDKTLDDMAKKQKIEKIKGTVEVRFVFDREDAKKLCENLKKLTEDFEQFLVIAKRLAYDLHLLQYTLQTNTKLQTEVNKP